MSRKNKNGKRRNYTPKTYGRDFLTPTPIERAIQEANKPASPQAVAVSDRIACDDKCSYEYKRMPAAWLETDFSYQRKIDAARVERIVNSFDPRLANEVKVSFRDGKFYVFDGRIRSARSSGFTEKKTSWWTARYITACPMRTRPICLHCRAANRRTWPLTPVSGR